LITSKQIINLSEEWFKSIKGAENKQVPVYVNPDSSDLKELNQSVKSSKFHNLIRFIANAKQQKVYVIDGYLAIHGDFAQVAGYINRQEAMDSPSAFLGYGILTSGKIKFETSPEDSNFKISSTLKSLKSSTFFVTHRSNVHVLPDKRWLLSIRRNYQWAEDFFKFNWNFVDYYISGFTQAIAKEKQIFDDWKKENYSEFIQK
jgi:hypothetical protein